MPACSFLVMKVISNPILIVANFKEVNMKASKMPLISSICFIFILPQKDFGPSGGSDRLDRKLCRNSLQLSARKATLCLARGFIWHVLLEQMLVASDAADGAEGGCKHVDGEKTETVRTG